MSNAKLNVDYHYKNLDKILKHLDKPDIITPAERKKHNRVALAVRQLVAKLFKRLARLWNLLFGDHYWYNEALAKRVIVQYVRDPNATDKVGKQINKIVEIYDRLALLRNGKGTWADGVDRELLFPDEEEDAISDEDLKLFKELDEMILKNVVTPPEKDDLDELQEEEVPVKYVEDPKGKNYAFERLPGLKNATTAKMLFHIQADEFGSSSQLEGHHSNQAVKYLHDILTAKKNKGTAIYDDLIAELNDTLDLITGDFVTKAQQQIDKSFHEKKPMMLIGGWTGNPSGHAIYYEIIPESNTTASFRLYNTGAGIQGNHHHLDDGNKIKYQTYCEWKGIAKGRLESREFLEAIKEMKENLYLPQQTKQTEYNESDIYIGLRNILKPDAEKTAQGFTTDPAWMMSPQRSGVCAWKSLMAFVRTKIDLNDYKRFKCDLRLQSLMDFVETSPAPRALDWRLVLKSHEKLCRSILRLHREKKIGDAYLDSAKTALKPVSKWLHDHEACSTQRLVERVSFDYEAAGKNRVYNKHLISETLDNKRQPNNASAVVLQPCQYVHEAISEIKASDPAQIGAELQKLSGIVEKAWLSGEDLALHSGLIDFIKRLDLNDEFWKKAADGKSDQAEFLITQFGQIARFFFKSCFMIPQASTIFPEKTYALHKILYLQQKLCRLGHPKMLWEKIGFYERTLPDQLNQRNLFLRFPDPKMQREIEVIRNSLNSEIRINEYCYHHNDLNAHMYYSQSDYRSSHRSSKFVDAIYQSCPNILSEVYKDVPNIYSLPRYVQEAYIYTSKRLPEWIKAMRDASLVSLHLDQSYVGRITPDRRFDLEPRFTVTKYDDFASISVGFSGVNSDVANIPEVKKIKSDEYVRFAGQYRDLATKPIQQIIAYLQNNISRSEKQLLAAHVKRENIPAMGDEEFKELAHLFLNPDLQLIETVEYFTKHPEKLKEPDYQTLLHILFFEQGVLEKQLKIAGAPEQLNQFIQKHFERFREENEIQTVIFLLKISHQLQAFAPSQPFFRNTVEELRKLLNRKGLEADDKNLVYAELVGELGKKESLSEEDIEDILVGTVYLEENQIEPKFKDPYTNKEVREALIAHTRHIQQALESGSPNQALLNRILRRLRPKEGDQVWRVINKPGEFPEFSTQDGKHKLYPIISRLMSSQPQILLPWTVREDPIFRQLFPNILYAAPCPNNVYSFKDQYGRETLVHMNGDHVIIDQKQGESPTDWFRLIPRASFLEDQEKGPPTSLLGSRYLVHHYTHWQSLEDKTLISILDAKTGNRKYRLKSSGFNFYGGTYNNASSFGVEEIIRSTDGAKLGKPTKILSQFEDTSYIHEWYSDSNPNRLIQIELPRFGLSFKPEAGNVDRLTCEQFPGFFLNSTASVKELGTHQHFILLENQKGERKVLLPQQGFAPPEKKEVLEPRYEVNHALGRDQLDPQTFLVYDVQRNGKLVTRAREGNLFLAHVLITAQEYKKAAYYLRKYGEKLSHYSEKEAQTLAEMTNVDAVTGDMSGDGIILRLYADYLLMKNSLSNHRDISEDQFKKMRADFNLYMNHYRHATTLKLKREEELFLLKALLNDKFNAIHYLRLKELDPGYARTLNLPEIPKIDLKPTVNSEETKSGLCGYNVPRHFKNDHGNSAPFHPVLLTRPTEDIKSHFLHYYDIARTGTQAQRDWLRQALVYVRIADKGAHIGMANFYEAILDNPGSFPAPITSIYYSDWKLDDNHKRMDEWTKTVKEAAERQLTRNPIQPNKFVNAVYAGDKTKKGFRFDTKQAQGNNVKVSYKMPTLSSLSSACETLGCFKEVPQKKVEELTSLMAWLKGCKSPDPLQQKELQRLQEDLEAYKKQPQQPIYTFNDQDIPRIEQLLAKDKVNDKDAIAQLEEDILNLANRDPADQTAASEKQLLQWGNVRKVLTIDELLVNFARQDSKALIQRNPALEETDITRLYELIGAYLLRTTRDQQRQRAQLTLEKLQHALSKSKVDPQEKSDLMHLLALDLLAKREFDPQKRPAFLVFEHYARILMRKAQTEKMEQFLTDGNLNPVMEMIMGSGKSKVLLPLLGLMRANPQTLSMLIVPQPLFESVSSDTQTILQDAFAQSLHSLHFERNTKFTKESLEAILADLRNILKNGECLIMTSKSVQCLVLKYLEQSAEHFKGVDKINGFPEELKIMQKIIKILGKSGYPIIDEADTVLNVLHEVCFSVGNRQSPRQYQMEVLSEIYGLLYEDPALRQLGRLESDPAPLAGAAVLTEMLYYQKLQRPLAAKFIERLGQMSFESKDLTNKVKAFVNELTINPEHKIHLAHYLTRDKSHLRSAQAFFDTLDEDVQDILALAGEEIAHLLPHTLSRTCDEKYGLDEKAGEILAIPYSAANTPNTGSQFANPHITMNYTFQTYMKKGVSRNMVETQVKRLQAKALVEIATAGDKIQLKDTFAWKVFCKLKGNIDMPLFNYKPCNIEDVTKRINSTKEAKREFVSGVILPQMEMFDQKMSCNPHNLVSLFDKVTGFTGTLWNGKSMHRKLKPEPEQGTDAKTLSILWTKSRDAVTTLEEGTTKGMLKQLKDKNITFDLISDAGGYFKEGINEDIAHQIAGLYGKEVVFYNQDGEQSITLRDKHIPLVQSILSEEERMTFLDQSHTTGADVKQKRDAIGLVTIGRGMLLRDLLQSVWRLRGLDKSQRVHFVMTKEVEGIIRQKLGLSDSETIRFDEILRFTIANQSSQQGRDNFKALKQELATIPQQILLEVLLKENLVPKAHLQAFRRLQSLWIKPAFRSPRELYGTLIHEVKSEIVLKKERERCAGMIEESFAKMPWLEAMGLKKEDCLKEVDLIINRMKGCLPTYVPATDNDDDQTVEVEQETQTEMETELEVEELPDTGFVQLGACNGKDIKEHDSLSAEAINKLWSGEQPAFPLKSYLENDPNLAPYASAFDGIYLTLNVLEWIDKGNSKPGIKDFQLLGPHRTPFHHLLVKSDEKDLKVIVMSQKEAAAYRDKPEYFNLILGYTDVNKKLGRDSMYKIARIKFLNGESISYSSEEMNLLQKWFKVQGVEKMRKLFHEHILTGHPKKADEYQNSPLQRLFVEMTAGTPG